MRSVLVTGFEPFGGSDRNPSGEAAQSLDGATIAGHPVHGLVLPCAFAAAPQALRRALDVRRPALVLCLGLAASRRGFHPERVAINWIDACIADNAGARPLDEPVVDGGPAAHFTTLPVKSMVAALQAAGHAAALSHTAGTFVCNQVFYALMHALVDRPGVRGGFVHVGGDLAAETVAAGTRVALQAALDAPDATVADAALGAPVDPTRVAVGHRAARAAIDRRLPGGSLD